MADNLGTGVSYVYDDENYNYDLVVFQKGKPPLDSEMNLAQQIQSLANRRQMYSLPSGWLTMRSFFTNPALLSNKFYTQDPSGAIPEYALVNGHVVYVAGTGTSEPNANLIDLGNPPSTSSRINGVYLEVWRALLDPNSDTNKPAAMSIIDALMDVHAYNKNVLWAVGENGLILNTINGGLNWNIQTIDTKRVLNGVMFVNQNIGFVVGANGVIGKTSSGGQKWNLLASNVAENLNDLYAVSQLIVYAVGNFGTVLKTVNGVNWLSQTSNVTANLRKIVFNGNVGWIVGDNGTILKTQDAGANWTQLTSGTTENLSSIFMYDLSEGYVVGVNGTILKTCNGGITWANITTTGITGDLADVTMVPNLDEYVNGEDVSIQASGTNTNFTTLYSPITTGNGTGTTSITPSEVRAQVNGVFVDIDVVDGVHGSVVLAVAPVRGDVVKLYYYHKVPTSTSVTRFQGFIWIVGANGVIYRSADLGATWIAQTSLPRAYDLHALIFTDLSHGWAVGYGSTIEVTANGSSGAPTWALQTSGVIARQIQRLYYEGNTGSTSLFLDDDEVHPDANIETTKRVQVQYRIRVAPDADPFNYPDSGLGSQIVVGLGPNSSGSFAFENMGPIIGDYGLYRAKCPGTVDGYSYAIPMFFVARRNSTTYSPVSNANGTSGVTAETVRLDLLLATNIIDSDILDVRRKIQYHSGSDLLGRNFDMLMSNELRTRLQRDTAGGDHYGTELLWIDRVGGSSSDGGVELNTTILGAVQGDISSAVTVEALPKIEPAGTTIHAPVSYDVEDGYLFFHQNPAYYSVIYGATDPTLNGKAVPGYFTGIGTKQVTFTFGSTSKTSIDGVSNYIVNLYRIRTSGVTLSQVPSNPQLVKNYKTGQPSFYYQGVLESSSSGKIIEQWDSGIAGYLNYSKVYPLDDSAAQATRASAVELHYFVQVTSSNTSGTNIFIIDLLDTKLNSYVFYSATAGGTISKINNVTSGFSYKISNTYKGTGADVNKLFVVSASGFPFLPDTIIEIIAQVTGIPGTTKNGASVNFVPTSKKIERFCQSILAEGLTITANIFTINGLPTYGNVVGISSVETVDSLTQPVCWVNGTMKKILVTNLGSSTVNVTIPDTVPSGSTATIQYVVESTSLGGIKYNDGALLIGYTYIPFQALSDLPTTLTVQAVTRPTTMYVSDIGTGGSLFEKVPFDNPLIHIPLKNIELLSDDMIYNIEPMRFSKVSIDSGFVELPINVPGDLHDTLVLSAPMQDNVGRAYYSVCANEFQVTTENLRIGAPRKIFMALIAQVQSSPSLQLLPGEYVMMIVSRSALMDTENTAGYIANDTSVIALYRLPAKPMVRI